MDKIIRKIKFFGIRVKAIHVSINVNKKAKPFCVKLKENWQSFFGNLRTILNKPVRQVSHLALVLMILVVLSTGLPAPEMTLNSVKKPVDPFGIYSITAQTEAGDKISAAESVAYIASVIDYSAEGKMVNEAYEIADQKTAKATLAVSGSSIAKIASLNTASSASLKATFLKYVIQSGDTLSSIAMRFGVTTDSIKWSNNISDVNSIKPGTIIEVPSINGIIYTVKSSDTLASLASKYKSQAALIEAQNDLYGESLVAGMKIIIPDGMVEEDPPIVAPPRTQVASSRTSVPSYVPRSSGPNRFPWGYCTWYVASRRHVPWRGNAWQWYGNAQAYGRPVGKVPVVGAIMVTWESSVGHVAYVERVNSDGSFTVSEMNYVGYGRISSRTVTTRSVPLIGFIY